MMHTIFVAIVVTSLLLLGRKNDVQCFVTPSASRHVIPTTKLSFTQRKSSNKDDNNNPFVVSNPTTTQQIIPTKVSNSIGSIALVGALVWNLVLPPTQVQAYESNDYASETVQRVIRDLRDNAGNAEGTVRVYEEIAAIITEGKGVGGFINYQGVQLERGYVSDEDTTIYNPGLTLLTESEKGRLVEAIIQAKRTGLEIGQWNIDEQAGYDYLREKLDPLHIYELEGFLSIVPFYGAFLYLIVLAIQQLARDIFPPAYIIAAGAFFAPILFLISIGPQ